MRAHIQGSEEGLLKKDVDNEPLLSAAEDQCEEKGATPASTSSKSSNGCSDIDPKDLTIRISMHDDDFDNDGFESSEDEDDDEDDEDEDDEEGDSGGDMEEDDLDIGAKRPSRRLVTTLSPRTRRRASKDFDNLFPAKYEGGSKIQLLLQKNKRVELGSDSKVGEDKDQVENTRISETDVPVAEREGRGLVPGGRVGGAPQQSKRAGSGWSGGGAAPGVGNGGKGDESGEGEETRSVVFALSSSSSSSPASNLSTSLQGSEPAGGQVPTDILPESIEGEKKDVNQLTLTSKEISEISCKAFRGVGKIFENYAASYQRIAAAMEEAHKCFEENVLLHVAAANQVDRDMFSHLAGNFLSSRKKKK